MSPPKAPPKHIISVLLASLILLGVVSPAISFFTFTLQIDKHLLECQHHRHHSKACHARCVLKEMTPTPMEATVANRMPSFDNITTPVIKCYQLAQVLSISESMLSGHTTQYAQLYAAPSLKVHSPPPKLV